MIKFTDISNIIKNIGSNELCSHTNIKSIIDNDISVRKLTKEIINKNMELINSIVGFIIAIGILVTFHEYGHYLVARLCDIRVLKFSVGFGKPIYSGFLVKQILNTHYV